MFVLLGLCILLAAMLFINSIASLASSLLWRGLASRWQTWSAAARASFAGTLRILPITLGIAAVGFVFAPAYVAHESRTQYEEVSVKLALVALFAAVGILIAVLRGVLTWRATLRLSNDWLAQAQRLSLPGVSIPTYRVAHQFPVIAIVGTFRPRLFIADRVLTALSPAELEAAISHEAGHLAHRDNLKRGLLRACRDSLLIIPCGRSLDVAWKDASEEAADEYAARSGSDVALNLAAALVKIARMIPTGSSPAMPAGAFLIGEGDGGGVANRVRLLVSMANADADSPRPHCVGKLGSWLAIPLMLVAIAIAATEPHVLAGAHSLIEEVVNLLT
jgi:Zn-dependent protease with chaperone function